MNYLLAALGVLIVALAAVDVWERHELTVKAEQAAAARAVNQVQIVTAGENHDAELAQLRAYRDSHPDPGPVQLCRAVVPATAAAKTGPRSAAADVQPLPVRNPDVRPVEPVSAGPDIADLLGLLAFRADQVSADLREQQSVQ